MSDKWRVGIIQNKVLREKSVNINKAREMIIKVADCEADVVVLPEMFNCPYQGTLFSRFAEQYPDGPTINMLSETAAAKKIYIFGGSVPEREGDQIYNTCFVFGPDGGLLAKYRKAHLFDVTFANGLQFKESAYLGKGNDITVVKTEFGCIGVAICYDIRFPELARSMTLQGASLIVVPAAFNRITGPAHWELLMRMRAVDNQVYVVGAAPARNGRSQYVAYGHSMVVDPWGSIVQTLDEKEGIMVTEIDPKRIAQVRNELPLLKHRRPEMY